MVISLPRDPARSRRTDIPNQGDLGAIAHSDRYPLARPAILLAPGITFAWRFARKPSRRKPAYGDERSAEEQPMLISQRNDGEAACIPTRHFIYCSLLRNKNSHMNHEKSNGNSHLQDEP